MSLTGIEFIVGSFGTIIFAIVCIGTYTKIELDRQEKELEEK
ncbi:MAG: hypothetical protein QMB22_04155 [Dehalococcoidia bacterium]|nr:hypothetical protein [Dehalococcoidia bacterium]PZC40413.1 MAG: hypothetical protein DK305_000779 [Chloroflexota bacterium]